MSWIRYTRPLSLAGLAISTALAQTPTAPPPNSKSPGGNRTVTATPPLRIPGASAGSPTASPRGTATPGTRTPNSGTTRREPCWQVAGISKSAMEQRRTLSMQTRQEVESVCADAALSAAQKQTRIHQIHEQERQQIDGLISPAQREAMHACQQQRGGGVGGGGGHLGGGGGPCGVRSAIGKRPMPPVSNEADPEN
jgi:hypothetical protein